MTGIKMAAAELRAILGEGHVTENEPLAAHCSFRTGGPADLFVRAGTAGELQKVLRCLNEAGIPVFLLGKGTNILAGDGGYRGAVVTLSGETREAGEPEGDLPDTLAGVSVDRERRIIRAGGGAALRDAALAARDSSLAGLEFAAGIPGSIGGAVMMNAGAYGGEMKQVVRRVRMMTYEGEIEEKSGEEMAFGYRTSILKTAPAVVLDAKMELTEGSREEIAEQIARLGRERAQKQPLEFASAGSTFKRPEGYFAGKLIMDAGLKGYRIGDAQVSDKHAGFLINRGNATSAQVRALIDEVTRIVLEKSGVALEREVIYLGEF